MTWRIHLDESEYTNAQKIAWEIVQPLKHVPILDYEFQKVHELSKQLEKFFSKQALVSAAKRIKS